MLGSCEYQFRQFSWPPGYRIGPERGCAVSLASPGQRAIGTVRRHPIVLRPRCRFPQIASQSSRPPFHPAGAGAISFVEGFAGRVEPA